MRIKIGKVQDERCLEVIELSSNIRIANSSAGIKPTALLSALDKENSIESLCISCILLIQLLHSLCTTFLWLSYDLICVTLHCDI